MKRTNEKRARKNFFHEVAAASTEAYDVDENGNVVMRATVTHLDSNKVPLSTEIVSTTSVSNEAFANPMFNPPRA